MSTQIIHGHVLDELAKLPERSMQCCVTSPPYWGLRDYKLPPVTWPTGWKGQHGLEPTFEAFIEHEVLVFRELRRVLRDDGTLWLNLGDSYVGAGYSNHDNTGGAQLEDGGKQHHTRRVNGLKAKDLCGIPWRVAFALQADGWYLRSDIIWHKPNPMPESVTDRPTKSHEYIFLLSKSQKYFYDADAIKDPTTTKPHAPGNKMHSDKISGPNDRNGHSQWETSMDKVWGESGTRNKRTVWTVATAPFKGAHFATFPPALITPCILAGSKKGDTILDPFGGSGTTAQVANDNGRDAIIIDLNAEYLEMARGRLGLFQPLV